ncbi:MAG TPA: ANTAR domain-containing protein [Microlunatus sp.]
MARISGGGDALGAQRASGGESDPGHALQLKIHHLEVALESQRLIGIAIGLVAQRAGCSSDDAWLHLVRLSQDLNIKVREIARILVDARNGRAAPADAPTLARLSARLSCGRSTDVSGHGRGLP